MCTASAVIRPPSPCGPTPEALIRSLYVQHANCAGHRPGDYPPGAGRSRRPRHTRCVGRSKIVAAIDRQPPLDAGAGLPSESGEHSGGSPASSGGKESNKVSVPLSNKVLVNVSGTMGTRYLLANITLVGGKPELKESVEKQDAQLRDVAASVLANKTIADIDKPGARNLIRTELVSAFNNVLGNGAVSEIFFTEFAIQ